MSLIIRISNNQKYLQIYSEWQVANFNRYFRVANLFILIATIPLIPFDFIFFHGEFRTEVLLCRVIYIFSCVIALTSQNEKTSLKWSDIIIQSIPACLYIGSYLYFQHNAEGNAKYIVLFGNIMAVIFGQYSLHKFGRSHYFISAVGFFGSLAGFLLNFASNDNYQFALLIVCNFACFILLYIARWSFVRSLHEKHQSLMNILPPKVARLVVVQDSDIREAPELRPRERFVGFISSDWRNFQVLTEKMSASDISNLFSAYYGKVFQILSTLVPEGTYFADWVADELSVSIYSDDDDEEFVKEKTLKILDALYRMSENLEEELNIKIAYDIGATVGRGFLGLQGPPQCLKTTLTATHAGIAKRLETEAKSIRNEYGLTKPSLLMDEALGLSNYRKLYFDNLTPIECKTKNISGKTYYLYSTEAELISKEAVILKQVS